MQVGVDTGGTFTDLVAEDGTVAKVPSTPDDPGRAVAEAVASVGSRPARLAHGTTVATNALLERRGAVVALVTNEGFEDLLEIARQDRPSLYDPFADRPEPLVPRALRFGVGGRLGADGTELVPIDVDAVRSLAIPGDVAAVAVCLLHADLNDAHERLVASELAARGFDVTASTAVSPEFREYERALTATVNAYLRPICRTYLRAIDGLADDVLVLSSAGGLLPVDVAAELPAALLLSGPAGGVRAAADVAAANGFADCVTFDMGGTSTDVCLVRGRLPEPAPGREIGGFPIRFPSLDMHTIGAGGGSIARTDPGGALAVGPRSAGAVPGPACYGRGGTDPTVTDADLVLGRIPADVGFPGIGVLDVDAAQRALSAAGVPAEGVVTVVDNAMVGALRRVTVERGVDPRGMALVAFGGAGPLHACALAEALGMAAVVVPPRAGVLSAAGCLSAPVARELVRSWPTPASVDGLDAALRALSDEVARLVGAGAEVETALDCRYAGQGHELTVPAVDAFPAEHDRRNGHVREGVPIEVVALRARAAIPSPLSVVGLPEVAPRKGGVGPLVLAEADCTIWVPPGWRADEAAAGSLVLRRT